jgi:protease-4
VGQDRHHVHEYNRGKNAGLLASSKKFDDGQRKQLKGWMDEVYDTFKKHVTDARGNRLKKPIDEIAGGRVYTGRQALDLGLVDQIGTMNDAIKHVAKKANLADGYAVRVIPEPKNFVEMLVEGMSGEKSADDAKHVFAGSPQMKLSLPRNGIGSSSITDLALPYLRQVDPSRVGVIQSALQRLDVLQNEGVSSRCRRSRSGSERIAVGAGAIRPHAGAKRYAAPPRRVGHRVCVGMRCGLG